MFILKLALIAKKEAPVPPKTEAKWMPWSHEDSAESHKKKKIHTPPTFQPNTLQSIHPGETSGPLCHHQIPQSLSQHRKMKDTLVFTWMSGQLSTDQAGYEETLILGQSHYLDETWLVEEGVCSLGSWLWCSGCCQQNWDHLNWIQLANSKYTFFTIKKCWY